MDSVLPRDLTPPVNLPRLKHYSVFTSVPGGTRQVLLCVNRTT
ncbi:hypothetical protein FOXG_02069 [Fusarium oxysporum f. sp. lycopersici 4287]|uniref:Uncharacterized protein n=2 Tax=Fusarium oxysporum TaxID=5507 RepID=A0A0J9UD96_FUSO4|nr:hypothetical protein FOXG_02069 [Fusarium oxysporum f. sp. lycopersici 4287]KNA97323.1 hypothetical protein FOXG_02069 [Fusarium oxysporum f. sp. lycopersici 4287]